MYVFGDDFTGGSVQRVVDMMDKLNSFDNQGHKRVRIHAVGFPVPHLGDAAVDRMNVRYATLMRIICERNDGDCGLNDTDRKEEVSAPHRASREHPWEWESGPCRPTVHVEPWRRLMATRERCCSLFRPVHAARLAPLPCRRASSGTAAAAAPLPGEDAVVTRTLTNGMAIVQPDHDIPNVAYTGTARATSIRASRVSRTSSST